MNSVIVFLPEQTRRSELVDLMSKVGTITETDQTILLESSGSRLYVDELPEPEAYYDWSQLEIIQGVLGSYRAVVIGYRDISLVKQLILKVAAAWPSVIDNDHELIAPGFEYLRRMKADPNWNWEEPQA